jgi:hypothetical protein
MAPDPTKSPRLGQILLLRSGVCVRLRLAHFSDIGAIAELIRRHGEPADDLRPERFVQFDPRRRYVVCALALIDGSERLVALGAIDLAGAPPEPDVLIADPEVDEELPRVLHQVLCAAAETSARGHAA